MKNFWIELNKKVKKSGKPFFCLAPMYDVTDIALRQMIVKYSGNKNSKTKNLVLFTEFVSADGLCSVGGKRLIKEHLGFLVNERPVVAQIFGVDPEKILGACKIIKKLGFDGIDLNMGCPDKSVVGQGAGAGLIKNLKLAKEIIRKAIEGAGGLPVSVKTRIGFDKEDILNWIPCLLEEDISALTVHLRTKKEMSLVPAHWELMKKVVNIARKMKKDIPIIGNGDVSCVCDGLEKAKKGKCDGIMIGRGVFGKPWIFAQSKKCSCTKDLSPAQKVEMMLEHVKLFDKYLSKVKNFDVMKKHFKAYVSGWEGAKDLRVKLMATKNRKEVEKVIKNWN